MEHKFKKQYGQNFIKDQKLLDAIVCGSNITKDSFVIEIGAGAGALTEVLAQRAKKVISFEIDTDLKEHLLKLEEKYDNLKFVFEDFMSVDLKKYTGGEEFSVVANLPYYITTAIISKLIDFCPKTMTIMVQKEVAERIGASPKNSAYGAMSVICQTVADVKIILNVPKTFFYPMPEVDSAVLHFNFNGKKLDGKFVNFLHMCFKAKRKTLVNNLSSGLNISKKEAENLLINLGTNINCRAEELSSDQFFALYKQAEKYNI
ncbi:MAG: ribosomal RNA small subunit methyltransferase A [Clostridia bacterium]|nr:ribosomal RNA small subunit methyltransferase A [Clostridia bacterium]